MHQRAVAGRRCSFDVATVVAADERFRLDAGFATTIGLATFRIPAT